MDVHERYCTESNQQIEHCFNERFILSLTSNPSCLCIDDELNLLPTTTHTETHYETTKTI